MPWTPRGRRIASLALVGVVGLLLGVLGTSLVGSFASPPPASPGGSASPAATTSAPSQPPTPAATSAATSPPPTSATPPSTSPTASSTSAPPAPRARSVIFVNGDGMSAAQREAGRLRFAGLGGRLQMDSLPISGNLTTDSRDPRTFVTDSAAGATAWSTGEKTSNGAVSVDVDGRPLPVLGAYAKSQGKATGLVTTAQVTDATPAAFFAQTADRGDQDEIARQYVEVSRPDVILGGGEDWWLPEGREGAYPDRPPGDRGEHSRSTKGDLVRRARQEGWTYVSTAAGLEAAKGPRVLGLFANEELFSAEPEGQGDRYDPPVSLARMTTAALDALSPDPDGFFLLVEEEGVDAFAHANNGGLMLDAMGRLDAAVAVARRYVADHPDTLLVVTGDHETGGLTVEDTDPDDESGSGPSAEDGPFRIKGSDRRFDLDWTTGTHTDAPVPVSATGPGADALTGQHPNTYVHEVLTAALRR